MQRADKYSFIFGLQIDRLIYVKPLKARYHPEVGDVVVGRIASVDSTKWRVDINSAHYASLLLTAINLPGGEQRRRSEEDKLRMREFYMENELLSGEVQSIGAHDGSANLHTRNLKYGKVGSDANNRAIADERHSDNSAATPHP